MTSTTRRGVVRGTTIELEEETGLPDGQSVTVSVHPIVEGEPSPEERFRRAFGAWADDAEELDAFMEWTRQQRNLPPRGSTP